MLSLFFSIPIVFVAVLGLILNIYILVAVILTKQISSANHILLLHLGTLDIFLGIIFLFFSVPIFTKNTWLSSGVPCLIHGFLFTLLHPMVLWTVCGLNCDRYYAIAAPLHYGHIVSAKKVIFGLTIGWIICIVLVIPPFFMVSPYSNIPGLGGCAPNFSQGNGSLAYTSIYVAFTLLIPATLIICCNLKILMIARYHRHRIASAIYEVTLSAQVTITHQRNPFFVPTVTAPDAGGPPKFRGKSAISTVLQILGSLLVLYVPYYSLIVWEATSGVILPILGKGEINPLLFTISATFLISTTVVNGFLYGVKSKTLRKIVENYWRKKHTKNVLNQEIQARTPSTCGSRRPSLTPLGFFNKPNLQRRLSEALLDVNRIMNSPQKSKIKRISSEITCRQSSMSSLTSSPKEEPKNNMPVTQSFNTLQVPFDLEPIKSEPKVSPPFLLKSFGSSSGSTSFIFNKFFGLDPSEKQQKKAVAVKTVLEGTPRRSPRILITRACSEESEKSNQSTPKHTMSKKLSASSSTLLDKKWLKKTTENDLFNDPLSINPCSPLLGGTNSSGNSDSSEISEDGAVPGRLYLTIDKHLNQDSETSEEQLLLLTWPSEQTKITIERDGGTAQSNMLKNTVTREIIL